MRWTVVRGRRPRGGESQGLPVWALFMVEALENDELVHEAPAIVGRKTASALTHAASD